MNCENAISFTKKTHSGRRAIVTTFSTNIERYSIIAACDMNGLFSYHIIKGTVNSDIFFTYIYENLRQALNPFPMPRSIVIIDNARIHLYQPFINLLKILNVRLHYLPPYAPFLNVIELMFNIVKMHLKKYRYFCYINLLECLQFILKKLQTIGMKQALLQAGYGKLV